MDWQNLKRVSIWKVWIGISKGASKRLYEAFKNLSKTNILWAKRVLRAFKNASGFERWAR